MQNARSKETAENKQQTVAHIGKHHGKEKDIEKAHEEGWVVRAVGGKRIHRHHPFEV